MKRFPTCLIFILIITCGLLVLGVWAFNAIQTRAEVVYGPASSNLGWGQKFLLSWRLLQKEAMLTAAADPFGAEISFHIEIGESPFSVAQRLENEMLILDAEAFRDFLIYAGLDTRIQAGDYKISPVISAIDIAYNLLDATPTEVPFVILAGWRLEEIATSLPDSGLSFSPELFLEEAQSRGLEGYLLPGTYIVSRTITVNGLLDVLIAAFEDVLTPDMKAGFSNQGLTTGEAVRLASIIEREAVVDNESPLIASVFLNRLAMGMKLEADPTVQYALGYNDEQGTWWTNPLSQADLQVDSPFNTYRYPGLPPSPICNPDVDALRAVAFPAQTPYFYFRATCDGDGRHNFAETYAEHLENACP